MQRRITALSLLICSLMLPYTTHSQCFIPCTDFYIKPGLTLSDPETYPFPTVSRSPLGGKIAFGFEKPLTNSVFNWGAELGLGTYGSYHYSTSNFQNGENTQNYTGIDLSAILSSYLSNCVSVFGKAGLAYLNGSFNFSFTRETGFLLGGGINYKITRCSDLGVELVHIHMANKIVDANSLTTVVPSFNSLQFFVRLHW